MRSAIVRLGVGSAGTGGAPAEEGAEAAAAAAGDIRWLDLGMLMSDVHEKSTEGASSSSGSGVASSSSGSGSASGGVDALGEEVVKFPVLFVDDVYLPGGTQRLKVSTPESAGFFDELLLSGSRLFLAALRDPFTNSFAEVATLLALEDLRDVSNATDGKVKYLVEHVAVGRARILHATSSPDARALQVAAQLLEGLAGSAAASPVQALLEAPLRELEHLQRDAGPPQAGEPSAAEFRALLSPLPPLPPALQACQGLWRAKSGQLVRIDADMACGLGRMTTGVGRVLLQVGGGGRAFTALAPEGPEPGEILEWDDGDTWTRVARPPSYRFSHCDASSLCWRIGRRWQQLAVWRAEVRRGESRWRSLEAALANTRATGRREEAGLDDAARQADADSVEMRWEEVLRPCQRLLQAGSTDALASVLRGILATEAARLRLRLAVEGDPQ